MSRYKDGRLPDRFWSKVELDGTHWVWTASADTAGGGQFRTGGRGSRIVRAASFAAQQLGGLELPEGSRFVRTCDRERCVRPEHFKVMTAQELREARWAKRKTCANGHPWTPENTAFYAGNHKARYCRACNRERARS